MSASRRGSTLAVAVAETSAAIVALTERAMRRRSMRRFSLSGASRRAVLTAVPAALLVAIAPSARPAFSGGRVVAAVRKAPFLIQAETVWPLGRLSVLQKFGMLTAAEVAAFEARIAARGRIVLHTPSPDADGGAPR